MFYGHSLLSADSRKAVLAKECAQVLVNRLEDLACPEKVWSGKLTAPDMTLMG